MIRLLINRKLLSRQSLVDEMMDNFYKDKRVVVLRGFFICFISVFLFACAGEEIRQGADEIEIKKTVRFNDID